MYFSVFLFYFDRLNERIMLSLVSTGVRISHAFFFNTKIRITFTKQNHVIVWDSRSCSNINCFVLFSLSSSYKLEQADCPFIVCMTYAFHTTDKLCFILDLMNGGDLHYHLSQHGVFNEQEMKFYAAEVILGEKYV